MYNFGRVVRSGESEAHTIENVKVNETGMPVEDVEVINVDVR